MNIVLKVSLRLPSLDFAECRVVSREVLAGTEIPGAGGRLEVKL